MPGPAQATCATNPNNASLCGPPQAQAALAFPNAFGLTVRYAMKSSPNAAILKARLRGALARRAIGLRLTRAARCSFRPQLFDSLGLHIDASSGFEVQRAMAAGVAASKARRRFASERASRAPR